MDTAKCYHEGFILKITRGRRRTTASVAAWAATILSYNEANNGKSQQCEQKFHFQVYFKGTDRYNDIFSSLRFACSYRQVGGLKCSFVNPHLGMNISFLFFTLDEISFSSFMLHKNSIDVYSYDREKERLVSINIYLTIVVFPKILLFIQTETPRFVQAERECTDE